MNLGKSKEADDPLALGKSAAVVMNLVKGLEHKYLANIFQGRIEYELIYSRGG